MQRLRRECHPRSNPAARSHQALAGNPDLATSDAARIGESRAPDLPRGLATIVCLPSRSASALCCRAAASALTRANGKSHEKSAHAAAKQVPGPGEVLVEVDAAPINYVDVWSSPASSCRSFRSSPARGQPALFGHTGAAWRRCETAATGSCRWPNRATLQKRVAVAVDQCYRLTACRPGCCSLFGEAASPSLVYDTAWFALDEPGRLEAGETVLVLGASGRVGEAVIDRAQSARTALREMVYKATNCGGADMIDPLGGEVFAVALRALARHGRLVVIGFAAGAIPTLRTN
jgi:NADPH2:quinone reductase